ncbi:MAG TPA: VWA domain-containing protein [Janthinobacterium sp.]|nr:VWA domain-containing protein [Janthinobacterium sp.]
MTALHNLHLLRPWWLLALPVLWLCVSWLARRRASQGDWSGLIDAELLPALRLDEPGADGQGGGWRPWPWLALAWTLAVLALAGPSWQQDSAPAYRAPAAWVLVLDLSPSMAAPDVAPNRVARARYALDDLLGAARDARVGMVAFSEEAYTVTPLTQDVATIRALLPSLAPDMMPTPGDHLAPALERAGKLLESSGAADKRIVVLSDGFDDAAAALAAAAALKAHGVAVSVVGVGSGGAPLRDQDGRFARDAKGAPLMARLDSDALQELAGAGGGRYVGLADLSGLVAGLQASQQGAADGAAVAGVAVAHWRDAGAFLLPGVLLLAALLARRRWL